MSQNAIVVENLSKCYLLGHKSPVGGGRYKYEALREVIGREARTFVRKATDLIHGRAIVQGDEMEKFWALKDVNFEIKEGEIVGIIGRNGAGKSTLLKILSRITEPTLGRALLSGRLSSLLEVGTGFHSELTGRENIFLNGAILGMTQREIRRKFDEIVAFADVERFLDTPVKRYSSGMYVRLAFAVAAHLEPDILVIDEVLAVGDTEFQKKCLGKMSDVAREGRTVLFVSHNHAAIRNLCTHGIVMRGGRASPKFDILTAIGKYSETQDAIGSSWARPSNLERPPIRFESIDVRLEGYQPDLSLLCQISITAEKDSRPSIMAVDILDPSLAVIMQAQPLAEPFIGATHGPQSIDLIIELPPLVPGQYSFNFWLGPHHTETYDYIRQAVTIQVVDYPTAGRTYPYSPEYGFIVPKSQVSFRIDAADRLATPSV